ncbi:MAG: PKD domain-containing protein, partial [Bacteroidota bacterium]
MLRFLCLLLLLSTMLAPAVSAQGSVDPLEQLCKKEKLGRNDPKSKDIEGQNGDPCSNNALEALLVNPSCPGANDGAIVVVVTGMRAPLTYRWSTGATTANINSLTAGSYSLVITDADGCTEHLSTFILDPAPLTVSIEVANATGAGTQDGTATATVLGGNGGYTYSWSSGATTATTGATLAPGNYTLSVTDALGCMVTAQAIVGNNADSAGLPLSANAGDDRISCAAESIQLGADQVAVGGVSPYTYDWSGPTALTTPTSANPFVGPAVAGSFTYSVTVTDATNTMATDQVTITVEAPPSLSLTAASNQVCMGDAPVVLTATPAGGTLSGAGVSGNSFDPATAGPGIHTIYYEAESPNGCDAFTSTTITVHPTVSASWTAPVGPIFPCSEAFFLEDLISGTPGGVFSGTLIDGDGSLNPALGSGPGMYPITYSIGEGSCAAAVTVNVEIIDLALVSIAPITVSTCDFVIPLIGQLQPAPVLNGVFSGGPYVTERGDFNPTGLTPGEYPIYFTYENGTCRTTVSGTVEVQSSNLQAGFTTLQDGNALFITDQANGALSYFYDFGDGNNSTDPSPSHAYSLPGIYEVCQTVADACTATTQCQQLEVETANSSVSVLVRAFLGGNYDLGANQMTDALRSQGLLPPVEPYTAMGYLHKLGGGQEAVDPPLLNQTGPNAPVDYVVIEIRHQADPALKLASQTCLITRSGQVIDTQGNPPSFAGLLPDDYFVALFHRNHLPVMTQDPVALQQAPQQVDFANPGTPTFGQHARMDLGGPFGLWPGDADFDGQIVYSGAGTDVNAISTVVFLNDANGGFSPSFPLTGYHPQDLNLDGQVIYSGSGTE